MAKGRPIRTFDYVNHPYDSVRDALRDDALAVFRSATHAATSRAHEVAVGLHVNLGALKIGTEIALTVAGITEEEGNSPANRRLLIDIEWEAAKAPRLFPLMNGQLAVYPLSATETQLDFSGSYEPPFGVVGTAVDALVGHRIADASVHRFVVDVADYLRRTLET
ncbi:MAG TPA: hypothetical protein VML95_02295 [Longimicrobiales bacterium]|nr:hypothetical protein [Longimicrobiales bacterium]